MQLNLNADLGESFGAWKMGDDEALLAIVDSANIACGFHAGDPLVMRNTVRAARNSGTSLGAHPAFPDLQGFGRRAMQMAPAELEAAVLYQLGALAAMAAAEGARLSHVKPHGALNNMACEDAAMADTVARAVKAFDPALILLAPVFRSSPWRASAPAWRWRWRSCRPRLHRARHPGAAARAGRGIAPVERMHCPCGAHDRGRGVVATSGKVLETAFHSICVYGDNAHAVATARQLRAALEAAGHGLHPLPALFGLPT